MEREFEMIRVCPLFSGSSGNSIYIEFSNGKGILVDAGRSTKQIENILSENNIDICNIDSVFVTHEHNDHISALKVLTSKHKFKVYGSEGTIGSIRKKNVIFDGKLCNILKKNETDLEFVSVKTFSISHDCCDGFGYVFTDKSGEKIAICTDLGYISNEVKDALIGCNTVILESNHDVMMLQNGPYPYYLKRRILSDSGHLSNETSGKFLPFLVNNGTKNIILSHLSSHNNVPALAIQTSVYYLNSEGINVGSDVSLEVAPKENHKLVDLRI